MPPPRLGCAVALVAGVVALMLPHYDLGQMANRMACVVNLKEIGLALQNYEYANGALPPATTYDQSGGALHSWRTAILPYMGQQALHSQLALDEPWDSRINRGYTVEMHVESYECPAHAGAAATGQYLAVVGDRTAWPPGRGRKYSEVPDGTANTLLVIEAPWHGVLWAEPKDLTFEAAVEYLSRTPSIDQTAHVIHHGYFYKPVPVVHVVYMNGMEGALPLPLPRETAEALLTVDGGEAIDESALDVSRAAELDYGRCYAFAAFVALALAPGVRRYRKGATSEGSPASC
ncbi:MAG TPA: DUF1559 domain-containing protein [Lacipirellula sp.]